MSFSVSIANDVTSPSRKIYAIRNKRKLPYKSDAFQITELLREEGIEVFVSSPYQRAILTIQELAQCSGQEVLIFEDLKERIFSSEDNRMPDDELLPLLDKSFSDPNFALTGGESNAVCQNRSITVLKELLKIYRGRKVALGTHGAVMTLRIGNLMIRN